MEIAKLLSMSWIYWNWLHWIYGLKVGRICMFIQHTTTSRAPSVTQQTNREYAYMMDCITWSAHGWGSGRRVASTDMWPMPQRPTHVPVLHKQRSTRAAGVWRSHEEAHRGHRSRHGRLPWMKMNSVTFLFTFQNRQPRKESQMYTHTKKNFFQ